MKLSATKKLLPTHSSTSPYQPAIFSLPRKADTMATSLPSVAIPGECLASTAIYSAGAGTYIQQDNIYASIAGPVVVDPAQPKSQTKSVLRVSRAYPAVSREVSTPPQETRYNTLPAVNSIVLARVTRVQKRQATVSILVVMDDLPAGQLQTITDNDNVAAILTSAANPENHGSTDELRFQALIRKEDVRAVEKDRVVMDEMFRVGDIVRGQVLSLGDQSFYYITTARNDLGVVMARSESGNMMFPASWNEMRDPISNVGEQRKVARPF